MLARLAWSSVLVASAVLALLVPRDAEACGAPPPPPPPDPCDSMHLYKPAEVFPPAVAVALRVRHEPVGQPPGTPRLNLDELQTPLEVYRQDANGWQLVPYQLVAEEGLVDGARHLSLGELTAGRHIVTWAGATCDLPDAPEGKGPIVGEFSLTDAVAYPTSIGAIDIDVSEPEAREYIEGVDGACNEIVKDYVAVETKIRWELPEPWYPWADVASVAVVEDGDYVRGFADVTPQALAQGFVEVTMLTLCDGDVGLSSIPEGPHAFALAVKTEGQVELQSSAVAIEIDCTGAPDIDDDGADGGGDGDGGNWPPGDFDEDDDGGNADGDDGGFGNGGCRVAPTPGALPLALLPLLAWGRRRR